MMKLAYRGYIVTLILLTFVLAATAQDTGNNRRSARDNRNTAPTVGTGGPTGGPTGLFTVYDGQTLRTGEFTFSAAYSNYDRDPGNVDIVEVPLSFQIGITDNIELFFNTDAYRAVKVNSPRNLSSFYLPNSRLTIGGISTSPGAIVLSPSGPGTGSLENRAVFRPPGSQPFVQFPFIGGSAGNFGLLFSGPVFGFPNNTNATLGPIQTGGSGADNFPGIGSAFGSILPGVVLQTVCSNGTATCSPLATAPSVFSVAPSYLNDAPFINRTYGESAFSTFTFGGKFRFTNVNNPVGVGIVAFYRFYADNADDFSGFNQLQRGSSAGAGSFTDGDFGVTLFADARLRRWVNLSANIGYHYNRSIKSDAFGDDVTLLDRGDELLGSIGVDFPVNRYFQPILEFRSLQYIGGRTPNAFENNPLDGIAGLRVFPARWFGFGAAYRHHFNQQDEGSFDDNDSFTTSVTIPCLTTVTPGCTSRVVTTTINGVPPGFAPSSDPHGFIFQAFAGRRDVRQADIINIPANVTNLTLSDTEIRLPCPPGFRAVSGTCDDSTSVTVTTTAVDVENDVLTYNYTVSGGRIVGTGANVSWDLSGVTPGTYTITSAVDDGCGLCGQTQTRTITIAECECIRECDCPTLSVSGPAGITNPGDTMTFTANVSGGTQPNITYNWSVTAGEIESGQGTPSITVRTTQAMANSNVTATVQIGGQDPACNCPSSDDETAGVAGGPESVLVDEFAALSDDDVRARLDAFFIELQNNPNNQGYIINYGTDREIAARERLITRHINFRNFDRSRITLVRGSDTGSGVNTRLYRIPEGAENPAP
ncbi:MAG: hypothetical protein M3449_06350 [Acidobacteriota bacterium]|nr:hypothetical protein [Acidobacteriota bacterium]